MAGAGAGGNTPPHQDKAGFFSSSQPFTFNEEHLAAKVEEERRVTEWREAEGREGAHNLLWTQFQQTAAALPQLYRQEAGQGRQTRLGEEENCRWPQEVAQRPPPAIGRRCPILLARNTLL